MGRFSVEKRGSGETSMLYKSLKEGWNEVGVSICSQVTAIG